MYFFSRSHLERQSNASFPPPPRVPWPTSPEMPGLAGTLQHCIQKPRPVYKHCLTGEQQNNPSECVHWSKVTATAGFACDRFKAASRPPHHWPSP